MTHSDLILLGTLCMPGVVASTLHLSHREDALKNTLKNLIFPLCVVTLVINTLLWGHCTVHRVPINATPLSHLLYRDTLSDVLSLFYAFSTLMVILVLPRHQRTPERLSMILFFTSLVTVFFHANHPVVLLTTWILSVVLFLRHIKGNKQEYLASQVLSLVLFITAVSFMAFLQKTFLLTMEWESARLSHLSAAQSISIATVIMLAGSLRQGVFPFHKALDSVVNHCELPPLLLTITANMGLYLVVRFAFPLIHNTTNVFYDGIMVWTSMVFFALAISVLTTNNIRKFFVFMMTLQGSLIFAGYLQTERLGEAGALIQWTVALLAGTGFGLCVWLFENRTGIRRLTKSTVCFDKMPRIAVLFLVFGMAIVDVPGTLGFVGEDLLIHSVLKTSRLAGVMFLGAMACASIAVYRSYVLLFLGRKLNSNALITDIVPREAYAFLAILTVLFGLGFYPTPLTHIATDASFHDEHTILKSHQ